MLTTLTTIEIKLIIFTSLNFKSLKNIYAKNFMELLHVFIINFGMVAL